MQELIKNIETLSKEKKEMLFKLIKEQGLNVLDFPITSYSGNTYPLSYTQERLWFLHQMYHGDASDNVPVAFRLNGELNTPILEASFNKIIQRHDVLRCAFNSKGTEVVQEIQDNVSLKINILDFTTEKPNDQHLLELVSIESRNSFDLQTPPLINVTVFKINPDNHVLLINMHHMVSDGGSMHIIYKELSEIYAALLQDRQPTLPELQIQYTDFAAWQRNLINEEIMEDQISYWMEHLKGSPAVLELPKDYPRPGTQSFDGAKHPLSIEGDLYQKLLALGKKEGCTLFMTLCAAFQVLLYRYSGSEDLVIATPIANRFKPEMEHLIGIFLNMLVLRSDLSGNPSFLEFLDRVKTNSLSAYEHQNVPFEKLVEKISPTRDMSYHPLFQVILQISPKHKLNLEGLTVELFDFDSGTAQYDLALHLFEDVDGLKGYFEYNTGLFDKSTIDQLEVHFNRLLVSIVEDPKVCVSDIQIITEQEKILISQWNNTARPYPKEDTLVGMFEDQVVKTPNRVALDFKGDQLTYKQLNEKANQLASHLRTQGVGPEKIAGILMDRSLEMVIAIYGILKAGGAYMPIDPEYPRERINFMIENANLDLVITSDALVDKVKKEGVVALKLDSEWDLIQGYRTDNLDHLINKNNLAYVIYTSGSTGRPKGVMNEHQGICNRLIWMQEEFQLEENDRVLQKTPFSFDVSVWEIFWPLLYGARLVIAKPDGHKDSAYLVDIIKAENITTIHFVPSMLQIFVEEDGVTECSSLKRAICSGEALGYDLQEKLFEKLECELYNLYGPTEAAVDVTSWKCQRKSSIKRVPIGKPISNTQTYILDKQMQLAPIGVPGELYLGGVQVARGYLNNAELTEERFLQDTFSNDDGAKIYKTGDLVRYSKNGNIEYIGRTDFQVKVRGFRIELEEIEQVLLSNPFITKAVVIVRNDLPGDAQLVAYIVFEGMDYSETELRTQLKQQLPEYMVPGYFVRLVDFPITVNGKLNRLALTLPKTSINAKGTVKEPKGDLERKIAEIWKDILEIENVSVADNFFDIGGHSLLMTKVHKKLKQHLQSELSIIELFKYPTIKSIARFLSTNDTAPMLDNKIQERVRRQKQYIFQKRRSAK